MLSGNSSGIPAEQQPGAGESGKESPCRGECEVGLLHPVAPGGGEWGLLVLSDLRGASLHRLQTPVVSIGLSTSVWFVV